MSTSAGFTEPSSAITFLKSHCTCTCQVNLRELCSSLRGSQNCVKLPRCLKRLVKIRDIAHFNLHAILLREAIQEKRELSLRIQIRNLRG